MREVDVSNLPKRNGGNINWVESIGHSVEFVYDDLKGKIDILDYDKINQKLKLRFKNKIHCIHSNVLLNCNIGVLINKINKEFYYEIGTVLDNVNSGRLKILEQIMKKKDKYMVRAYVYKCLICSNMDSIFEHPLRNGTGCNVCSNQKVLQGVNDVKTTHPEFASLFWNDKDTVKYTFRSTKKADFKCPSCGDKLKDKIISNMYARRYACMKCSDGVSFPEKIMYNTLKELNIEFKYQKVFSWSNNRRFDFYIPLSKCIVEMHGQQHYIDKGKRKRTFQEEVENDKFKKKIALQNNCLFVEIDCFESDFTYIKNNIVKSELSKIINLSTIDWKKVKNNSYNSLIKITCELWESGLFETTTQLAKKLNLSRITILKYLKKGASLNWCKYDPKKQHKLSVSKNGKLNVIGVIKLSSEGKYLLEYGSITEASIQENVNLTCISNVCKGKQKTAGGFKWMYKSDYDKLISISEVTTYHNEQN